MSNKPLRVREKGALLQAPPAAKPARAGPLVRLKEALRRPRLRRGEGRPPFLQLALLSERLDLVGQAPQVDEALGLCLLGLCADYTLGLGDNATAVVAGKRELPIYSVERDDKVLAISFDASWGADKTLSILDILDEHGVKTTFFLVGGWVDKYPDMVKEIFARGHEIGNHSDTHPHMSQLSESAIKDELRIMSDKVEKLTGVRPTLFRPPYGDYNNRVVEVSRAEGYECVQWSIDSLDWKDRGTEDIIKQCTYRVDNGDIVLFHNDSNDIVNALPTVIKHYQGLGYTILPVSELLLDGEYTIDVQGKQHPKET